MTLPSTNFHSSGLRQKVDQLVDILWSGGVNNPMDSIEQLPYLLFLRLLSVTINDTLKRLCCMNIGLKRIHPSAGHFSPASGRHWVALGHAQVRVLALSVVDNSGWVGGRHCEDGKRQLPPIYGQSATG